MNSIESSLIKAIEYPKSKAFVLEYFKMAYAAKVGSNPINICTSNIYVELYDIICAYAKKMAERGVEESDTYTTAIKLLKLSF